MVPNAGQVDLYDRVELIPFDKLTAFFTEHLKQLEAHCHSVPEGQPHASVHEKMLPNSADA
jgi:hypothetical protein